MEKSMAAGERMSSMERMSSTESRPEKPRLFEFPHPRFNAALTVQGDTLYIYGGTYVSCLRGKLRVPPGATGSKGFILLLPTGNKIDSSNESPRCIL